MACGTSPRRTAARRNRGLRAVGCTTPASAAGGFTVHELQENIELKADSISIATLHLAKGLEFKAVVVMACDDEIIPRQERIDAVGDEADLEDVFDTERHLLYVGCTRARDHLVLTSAEPASEFLDDF